MTHSPSDSLFRTWRSDLTLSRPNDLVYGGILMFCFKHFVVLVDDGDNSVSITSPDILDIPTECRVKFFQVFDSLESLYGYRSESCLSTLKENDEDNDYFYDRIHEFVSVKLLDVIFRKVVNVETPDVYEFSAPRCNTVGNFLDYPDDLRGFRDECESGIEECDNWEGESSWESYSEVLNVVYREVLSWCTSVETPHHSQDLLTVYLTNGRVSHQWYQSLYEKYPKSFLSLGDNQTVLTETV